MMRNALSATRAPLGRAMRVLLIGPYDPHCGEYTFLAPPLGVWRLAGYLESLGHEALVFDPNCCTHEPEVELAALLARAPWDVIGVSTTGMTLRFDLALAHLARRKAPDALLVGGGMEATFAPEQMFALGPFDLVVLGEGEKPLATIAERLASGAALEGIAGTAVPLAAGGVQRFHGKALSADELRDAIALTPYERMPYPAYWRRLERAYRANELPHKAAREARLAEIRSVRLITLNYCPMACSFCSSTNFLHAAQGSVAKIAQLAAADCIAMIERIVVAQPDVRTVIFQDDIFVFTNDKRIEPLCVGIIQAKHEGRVPRDLEFISTNRIDSMNRERLTLMKAAGFRVVGFGVESFSPRVLEEFNKGHIYRHIEPVLTAAVELGLRPFLDLILCSPNATLADVAETVRQSYRWIVAGCEVGLYPYVIPFSGARMASDPKLAPYVTTTRHVIAGTQLSWEQPSHILPVDPVVRRVLADIVTAFENDLARVNRWAEHVPSRARSLLWIAAAIPVLEAAGEAMPDPYVTLEKLYTEVGRPAQPEGAPRRAAVG